MPLSGHGTALPAAPAKGAQTHGCQQGGNTALTSMCQALQSANQGLTFALQRGLEALWLQRCCDHVCGPAAGLSIPLMPASSRLPRAVWEAAGSSRRAQGLKQTPAPALAAFGSPCGHRQGGRGARTVLCAERGSAHPQSREVSWCFSLYLQWYFIYSRVCLQN